MIVKNNNLFINLKKQGYGFNRADGGFMKLDVCPKICLECPFSKNSPRGWLGPHSLQGVLDAQQAGKLFSCHLQRKEGMTTEDITSGEVKICRGFLASALKSGIKYDEIPAEASQALAVLQQKILEENKEDKDTILSRGEFEDHHGGLSVAKKLGTSQEELDKRRGLRR